MTDKLAIILMGMPCSGKSTARQKLLEFYNPNNTLDFVVLSTDDYLDNKAKELSLSYNEVFKKEIKHATKQLKTDLDDAIKEGKCILWDQTNLTKKKRKYIMDSIPNDYDKIIVYLDTPWDILMQRNKYRTQVENKTIPFAAMKAMWDSIELVTEDEEFDILQTIPWKEDERQTF